MPALDILMKNIFSKKKKVDFFVPQKISSFEKINLFIAGMRFSNEYEIINKGEKTEISLYLGKY